MYQIFEIHIVPNFAGFKKGQLMGEYSTLMQAETTIGDLKRKAILEGTNQNFVLYDSLIQKYITQLYDTDIDTVSDILKVRDESINARKGS